MRLRRVNTCLVNIEILDNGIETRVEVVQQIDHLQRRALRRQAREAHDVAEVNCHLIVRLGDYTLPEDQLRRHRSARRNKQTRAFYRRKVEKKFKGDYFAKDDD